MGIGCGSLRLTKFKAHAKIICDALDAAIPAVRIANAFSVSLSFVL